MMLSTENLGGVTVNEQQLREMHAGDYILHAREGILTKVPVEKIRLPLDPKGHYQNLSLIKAPDDTIYASQETIMSKSVDGGKTWKHLEREVQHHLQFSKEGKLLCVRGDEEQSEENPTVWSSSDEGLTWEQIGQIDIDPFKARRIGDSMIRLRDGTLIIPIKNMVKSFYEHPNPLYAFRSKDSGQSFPDRSMIGEYCTSETNLTELPSGRLLAVIRYQPGPPDKPETGKTVFLADSDDSGATWFNMRQLTTINGQAHGAGVGLSNNRVVVAYDHRYPRELATGRAMVSHDGGQKWEDEVYYLIHGNTAGYHRHLTLDGEELLTFVGQCYGDVDKGWDSQTGNSHFVFIRWKLV